MRPQTKNKLTLFFIAALFFTPVIVAIVLNSDLIKFSPDSYKNRGQFIKPPVLITDNEALKPYEEFWTVVYQHSGDCQDACLKMLDSLYRIRLSRGHKMDKIKLLVLTENGHAIKIPQQYSSISQYSYQKQDKLNEILTGLSTKSLGNGKGLYLLSPEGFLMMSYSNDFKPDDVMDDLGLLLRARKNEG